MIMSLVGIACKQLPALSGATATRMQRHCDDFDQRLPVVARMIPKTGVPRCSAMAAKLDLSPEIGRLDSTSRTRTESLSLTKQHQCHPVVDEDDF